MTDALAKLGFADPNTQNTLYAHFAEDLFLILEPFWRVKDPRPYVYDFMMAVYQMGITLALEKLGY